MKELSYAGPVAGLGAAMGEEWRDDIRELVDRLRENLKLRANLTSNDLISGIRESWSKAYAVSPRDADVLHGLSEASGVSLEEIEFVNSFMELISNRSTPVRNSLVGCTTFALRRHNTTLLAQNYDMERFYGDFAAVARVTSEGATVGIFTFTGVVACAGVSSRGWGVGINFLHAADVVRGGLPHASLVFDMLFASSPSEALGVATYGDRACGAHYLIALADGPMFSAEVSGREHSIVYKSSGALVHTNHFRDRALRHLDLLLGTNTVESARTRRGSSMLRLARAEQLLREGGPEVSPAELAATVLGDGCGGETGILMSVDSGNGLVDPATIASVIIEVSRGRFTVVPRAAQGPTIVLDVANGSHEARHE